MNSLGIHNNVGVRISANHCNFDRNWFAMFLDLIRDHLESTHALRVGGNHPKACESVLEGGGSEGLSVRVPISNCCIPYLKFAVPLCLG